ncbi:hypothetical protein C4D60_Mb07t07380 [Musa balbisiana]|uniref:Secreted protein n=1 Tax=Musa balbisiana TaxID=52838 RepID=A0A4S8JFH7_MUSBA|nr:hypothetical protein C4D60_Mb07t07380 [Musa balbisiana]
MIWFWLVLLLDLGITPVVPREGVLVVGIKNEASVGTERQIAKSKWPRKLFLLKLNVPVYSSKCLTAIPGNLLTFFSRRRQQLNNRIEFEFFLRNSSK